MKKILLLAVVFGGTLAFTSCSSQTDHTCLCTTSTGSSTSKSVQIFEGIDEDAASSTCTSLNYSYSGSSRTCTIVD